MEACSQHETPPRYELCEIEQVNLLRENYVFLVGCVSTFENYTNMFYVYNVQYAVRQTTCPIQYFHILLVDKIKGMDVSGIDYTVRIFRPLTI